MLVEKDNRLILTKDTSKRFKENINKRDPKKITRRKMFLKEAYENVKVIKRTNSKTIITSDSIDFKALKEALKDVKTSK